MPLLIAWSTFFSNLPSLSNMLSSSTAMVFLRSAACKGGEQVKESDRPAYSICIA